jgi:hypothetical protein
MSQSEGSTVTHDPIGLNVYEPDVTLRSHFHSGGHPSIYPFGGHNVVGSPLERNRRRRPLDKVLCEARADSPAMVIYLSSPLPALHSITLALTGFTFITSPDLSPTGGQLCSFPHFDRWLFL